MATHLPGKSHGQRSLAGYSPWGCKSDLETKPTPCLTWRPSLDMPCFLASVTSSGCRWEDPWVPWQQANCHGHVPIYNPLPLQSFLLFTFIQGLLGVGSVLHNKTIGGNCGTPDLRKPRWRNQSSIKVVIWLPIGVKGDQSTWPRPCCCSVAQSFLTVFNPMDCNIPGFLPFIISWNLFKLMSIELVIQSKHLNFCHPLFLLPSQSFPASGSFPVSRLFTSGDQSIRASASAEYSFISSSNEYSVLISFRMTGLISLQSKGLWSLQICHCFHFFPIHLPWSDGTRCHDLSFLNVEF